MKTTFRKPCSECPFRRDSAPGWLGPWEPTELIMSLAHSEFPCHRTIPSDGDTLIADDRMEACAGAAIFLNNKIERSRNPVTAAYQDMMRDVPAEVKASVFKWGQEFLDHHAEPMKDRLERIGRGG